MWVSLTQSKTWTLSPKHQSTWTTRRSSSSKATSVSSLQMLAKRHSMSSRTPLRCRNWQSNKTPPKSKGNYFRTVNSCSVEKPQFTFSKIWSCPLVAHSCYKMTTTAWKESLTCVWTDLAPTKKRAKNTSHPSTSSTRSIIYSCCQPSPTLLDK